MSFRLPPMNRAANARRVGSVLHGLKISFSASVGGQVGNEFRTGRVERYCRGAEADEPLRTWNRTGRVRRESRATFSRGGGAVLQVTVNGQSRQCEPDRRSWPCCGARRTMFRHCATIHDWRRSVAAGCASSRSAGQSRPVAACTTLLADGMEISTHTPEIEQLRRTQLRLLASHYPKQNAFENRLERV